MKVIVNLVLEILASLFLIPYLAYCVLFVIFCLVKTPHKIRFEGNYEPSVSLVIATFNEEEHISEKLANTVALDYPSDKLEIIVVDSSTDATPRIVQEWMSKYQVIRLLKEECRRGLASALNLAYSAATSEIVIKSDCDILLARDAVRQIVSNFADSHIGAVSGRQMLMSNCDRESGYRSLIDFKRLIENQIDSIYLLEPFSGFRGRLIEPIDSKSVADDAELGLKIRKKGYKVVFDPDAHFYEQIPSGLLDRLRIKQRRAQGHIRLMCSHLDILFNSRYKKYGLLVFPLNFLLIVVEPWIAVSILLLLPATLFYMFTIRGIVLTGILYLLGLASYGIGRPKALAGFIDSQLALVVASVRLALRGPSYMWKK